MCSVSMFIPGDAGWVNMNDRTIYMVGAIDGLGWSISIKTSNASYERTHGIEKEIPSVHHTDMPQTTIFSTFWSLGSRLTLEIQFNLILKRGSLFRYVWEFKRFGIDAAEKY